MNKVSYISHITEESIDEIKALSLYFDEINIIEQFFKQKIGDDSKRDKYGNPRVKFLSKKIFTHNHFKSHLKAFENNGLLCYKDSPHPILSLKPKSLHQISSDQEINSLILNRLDLIGGRGNEKKKVHLDGTIVTTGNIDFNAEAKSVINSFFPNSKTKDNDIILYYGAMFKTLIEFYEKGENIITTSKYLNTLFSEINKSDRFKEVQKIFKNELEVSPSFAFEAIKLGVPNLGILPPEEILKFKEKSRSELLEFQKTLESITLDLITNYDELYITNNAQKIANLKIKPLIENINKSMEMSDFKILQDLIREIKDPKSYSPLLLTFSNNISSTMAILVSLGLIGVKAGLEHYVNIKEIKKDGVYYLFKMNKQLIR